MTSVISNNHLFLFLGLQLGFCGIHGRRTVIYRVSQYICIASRLTFFFIHLCFDSAHGETLLTRHHHCVNYCSKRLDRSAQCRSLRFLSVLPFLGANTYWLPTFNMLRFVINSGLREVNGLNLFLNSSYIEFLICVHETIIYILNNWLWHCIIIKVKNNIKREHKFKGYCTSLFL